MKEAEKKITREEEIRLEHLIMDDKREPIVLEGDQNNAFLPRFKLEPYSGIASGLSHKS